MPYSEYQRIMAMYGFIKCPLSEPQYVTAQAKGLGADELYSLGCDVNAGIEYKRALSIALARR